MAANEVKSGNRFRSLCCHDVYADITAGMFLPLVVFLRYFGFECFLHFKKRITAVLCRLQSLLSVLAPLFLAMCQLEVCTVQEVCAEL